MGQSYVLRLREISSSVCQIRPAASRMNSHILLFLLRLLARHAHICFSIQAAQALIYQSGCSRPRASCWVFGRMSQARYRSAASLRPVLATASSAVNED